MSIRSRLVWSISYILLAVIVALAIPLAIVEPLKLVGALVFGAGHLLTGTTVVAVAYAGSLFVIHRLFKIVKPNLMRLSWFARLWEWLLSTRRKAWRRLRAVVQ